MVVVIGGGISGLSAALRVCQLRRGAKVTVIESSSKVGGWISSTKYDNGSVFEHGPRTIRPVGESGAATLSLIENLGLQDKVMSVPKWHPSARNRFIYADGKLHKLPADFASLLKRTQPFSKPLYYAGFRDLVARRGPSDESIHDFVGRRFGPDIANYLIDPLIRGICAGNSKEISVNFLLKDIKATELKHRSVILSNVGKMVASSIGNAFSRGKKIEAVKEKSELSRRARTEGWSVWTLEGGLQTLTDSLLDHLEEEGVDIKLNAKISSLKFKNGRAVVTLESGEELETENVISAIPTHSLAPLLSESHPELGSLLETIKSVTVGVANFEYPGKDLLKMDAFGFLVPSSEDLPVLGVVFDTCSFPQGDKTILTVMHGGHWFKPTTPEQLEVICRAVIAKTLDITAVPTQKNVQILDKCIPQYTIGHTQRVEDLDRIISNEKLPLTLVGASYRGVSVNDCVHNAMKAVDNLVKR